MTEDGWWVVGTIVELLILIYVLASLVAMIKASRWMKKDQELYQKALSELNEFEDALNNEADVQTLHKIDRRSRKAVDEARWFHKKQAHFVIPPITIVLTQNDNRRELWDRYKLLQNRLNSLSESSGSSEIP